MARLRSASKSAVFVGLFVCAACLQFVELPFLRLLLKVLSFLSWLLALPDADTMSKSVSLALVAAGTFLFGVSGASPWQALASFSENTQVLMVMVLVPLLGTVIELGGYSGSLRTVCRSLRSPIFLHLVAAFLAYCTGAVLLNGSIALVWAVMMPIVRSAVNDPDTFLASSIPRGYNASILWSPASPPMAVALALTGATWPSLLHPGFVLSLVMFSLATLIELRNLPGSALPHPPGTPDASSASDHALVPWTEENGVTDREAWRKVGGLAFGLASIIGTVVWLEYLGLTPIQAMVPAVVAGFVIWSILIGKPAAAFRESVSYVRYRIPGLSKQYLLMTTAGFIGTAARLFVSTRVAWSGSSPLGQLGQNTLLFTLATSGLTWLVSIIGIHPLIGMTVVHSVISPLAPSYSPRQVALALLLGSALGFNISPVSATMLVTSSCCGKSTIDTGIRLQWRFVLCVWLTGSLILGTVMAG